MSLCSEDGRDRSQGDSYIQPEAPVFDVLEVEGHVGVEGGIAACGDLPQTGEAGLYVEAAKVLDIVALKVVDGMRTGADEAHFAPQDIPELRNFVEA